MMTDVGGIESWIDFDKGSKSTPAVPRIAVLDELSAGTARRRPRPGPVRRLIAGTGAPRRLYRGHRPFDWGRRDRGLLAFPQGRARARLLGPSADRGLLCRLHRRDRHQLVRAQALEALAAGRGTAARHRPHGAVRRSP